MKHRRLVLALGLCSWLCAAPASAQLARLGETFSVWSDTSRGSAVGYDTRNNVYLVVSAHGRVNGRFVSADGAVLGDPFVLQAVVSFGQFPQLAYSPDANGGNGAFLVTWHESDGPAPSIHSRMVSYSGGFLTPDRQIVGNDTYHEIMGAPVVYSTVSREFFVIWRQYSDVNIFGLRLNNSGEPISGGIGVAAGPLFESDPSLTYNPATDEYLAVYRMGFSPTSVMAQRIKAGTGALVGGPSIVSQASTINTTGVTYNASTGQYLVAWHQMPGDLIAGRVVAADGTPLGNVTALSTRVGTYDSLSIDANEVSGTVLLVGHDKLSVEVGGVEVSAGGAPLSAGEMLTAAGGGGNHVPKVSSNPSRREWMVTAARNFAQTIAQRVGTSSGGGQPPPPPPPPPRTTADTRLYVDSPRNGATVAGTLAISGWALDVNASAGNGVDAVHAYAFPLGGGQIFLGSAAFSQRLDVASYFGDSRFSNSGFTVFADLPPGIYTIGVYARSTVTGTFHAVWTAQIRITPPSNPHMALDQPLAGWPAIPTSFWIRGWAIDASSFEGSGVEAVHAWAYPVIGSDHGAPVWVGAASVGTYRPDVAQAIGNAQFAYAGFEMVGTLPPGVYDLVVYARSWIAGSFNNWRMVRITVN